MICGWWKEEWKVTLVLKKGPARDDNRTALGNQCRIRKFGLYYFLIAMNNIVFTDFCLKVKILLKFKVTLNNAIHESKIDIFALRKKIILSPRMTAWSCWLTYLPSLLCHIV